MLQLSVRLYLIFKTKQQQKAKTTTTHATLF